VFFRFFSLLDLGEPSLGVLGMVKRTNSTKRGGAVKVKDGGMGATSNKVMLLFTLVFTLSK
jgi:hypothetical protein